MKNLFGSLFLCILPFQQFRSGSDRRQYEVKLHNRIVYTNYAVPTGNLDTKTGEEIMRLFHELHEAGNTIVLITHDNGVAEEAERKIRIRDGSVEEVAV